MGETGVCGCCEHCIHVLSLSAWECPRPMTHIDDRLVDLEYLELLAIGIKQVPDASLVHGGALQVDFCQSWTPLDHRRDGLVSRQRAPFEVDRFQHWQVVHRASHRCIVHSGRMLEDERCNAVHIGRPERFELVRARDGG